MKYIYSFVLAALCAFVFCIYIPEVSYFGNVNEFVFDGKALLQAAIGPFSIVLAGIFVLLALGKRILPVENVQLYKWPVPVGPLDIFVWALILGIWFEGALLSKNLPSLTGEAGLFDSTPRLVADSLVWLIVLVGSLYFWRRLASSGIFILVALILLLAAGTGDAWMSKGVKFPVNAERSVVLDKVAFHPEKNTLIILADAFPADIARDILEKEPELKKDFTGFIHFPNNLATGGRTNIAIPSIMQGKVYEGEDYVHYMQQMFRSADTLPRLFHSRGYNIYISSLIPAINLIWNADLPSFPTESIVKANLDWSLYIQLSFRFTPYALKKFGESIIMGRGDRDKPACIGIITDQAAYNSFLVPRLTQKSSRPTFHFHHFWEPHPSYTRDGKGNPLPATEESSLFGLYNQCEWSLRLFAKFINNLKKQNLYNGATIVLMSDHGDYQNRKLGNMTSFDSSLLMLKPPENTGELRYSEAPFSNAYLLKALRILEDNPSRFADFVQNLPPERKLFEQPDQLYLVEGVELDTAKKVVLDFKNKQEPTVLVYDQTYLLNRFYHGKQPVALSVRQKNMEEAVYIAQGKDSPGEIAYRVAAADNSIDIEASLFFNVGKSAQKTPIPYEIADLVAKKVVYNGIYKGESQSPSVNIFLKDVRVDENGEIVISLKLDTPKDTAIVNLMWLKIKRKNTG